MKELSIMRNLDEETRLQEIVLEGKVYSLHLSRNKEEVIVTDTNDYSKIYSVHSKEFWDSLK